MTTNGVRKSDGQQEALKRAREAAAETLSLRRAVEASSAAAPVDSGTDPPPAGRFRRSCRTPTAQVQSGRPLQLPSLLRTARRRLVEAMPQYVYQPHPPGTHAHAPQLSPSRCVHRSARHARANLQPTALWGRLLRRPLLHRSSPPRRPPSSPPRRSGRCLPAYRCTRLAHAHAHARPAFDPATAAVRRCRIG